MAALIMPNWRLQRSCFIFKELHPLFCFQKIVASDIKNAVKSLISANYSKQSELLSLHVSVLRLKLHHFCTTSFHVITQSRSNPAGYLATLGGLENMFVSRLAGVFAVIVSEAETLMSAPRYAGPNPRLRRSSFLFQPSLLCVGDEPLPSLPS